MTSVVNQAIINDNRASTKTHGPTIDREPAMRIKSRHTPARFVLCSCADCLNNIRWWGVLVVVVDNGREICRIRGGVGRLTD